jgi:hypothetical protein
MRLAFTEEDWARVGDSWAKFWEGSLDRPIVVMKVEDQRMGEESGFRSFFPQYPETMGIDELIEIETTHLERMLWIGDAHPRRFLNFGPGSLAACMGSELEVDENTVWFKPTGKPLGRIPVALDRESRWFRRIGEIREAALEAWGGAVQLSFSDLGGNLDILASLRGTEDFLMDLAEDPETVGRLSRALTSEWLAAYAEEASRIRSAGRGTCPWAPIWSKDDCYMFQCDLSAMISPAMFERFVLPDLSACCDLIPGSFYHLDGPGEIPHLDLLLSLPKLKGIQWIPGAGRGDPHEWPELLSRIRAGGKFCQIFESPDGAVELKRSMDLRGFVIQIELPPDTGAEEARRLYEFLVS